MKDAGEKECVGSLLVASSDVQELSDVAPPNAECVGSMLVDSKDLVELSDAPKPELPGLQKRATAVGTLFVDREDLATHTSTEKKAQQGDGYDHRPEMIG